MFSDSYTNCDSCLAFWILIPKWCPLFYFNYAFDTADLYAGNYYYMFTTKHKETYIKDTIKG